MQATFDVRLQGASNVLVDRQEIEPFRIEMPATPMLGFLVLGMLRIADHVQKLLISREALIGFRGGGTPSSDDTCDEGVEQCFSAPACVVHELEEAKIMRELFLGDATMWTEPRA
jgi:hypothetical protein